MSTVEALWLIGIGFVLGWGFYWLVLQLAYRFGIVDYKGLRLDAQKETS